MFIKANKSLHILRALRKEGYDRSEIHLLFNTIKFYSIIVMHYLSTLCPSRIVHLYNVSWTAILKVNLYTSKRVSFYDFLERQDRKFSETTLFFYNASCQTVQLQS